MKALGPVGTASLRVLPLQVAARSTEAALPLLLAFWFGRDQLTDVYYFGWALFGLAGSLVFSAFQDSAVIPVLTEVRLSQPHRLPVVRGSLLGHTLVVGGALAAAVGALAALWLSIRYEGPARSAALWMAAPFALCLWAASVRTFLGSVLQAEHHFAPSPVASAASAVVNVTVLATLRHTLSIVAIPCASLAGEIAAIAWLSRAAIAAGMTMTPTLARPEPVRRIARLVASEIAGGAVTRLNPVVDQLMAGLAGVAGGGTLLKLSGDVASVPTSLLQAVLLPVLLTHLSEHFVGRDVAALRVVVRRALASVVCLLAAASAVLWAVRAPLLRLLFAHGTMDAAGVALMTRLFPYHLAGVAAFGALLVLARAHVAMQNSRIMVSMGLLNAGLNAGLNAALLPVLGVAGIALSTSCTYAVVAVVFFARLERLASRLALSPAASPIGAAS